MTAGRSTPELVLPARTFVYPMRFAAICGLAAMLAVSSPAPAADQNPKILSLYVSSSTVRSGDTVFGKVVTSNDVSQVEAHLAAFSVNVPFVSAGHFALRYVVPPVPFFLRGHYTIDVVARTPRGLTVHQIVPITVH